METLLLGLEEDIQTAAAPWFYGEGDSVALLHESLTELVRVCYEFGPILRAVSGIHHRRAALSILEKLSGCVRRCGNR